MVAQLEHFLLWNTAINIAVLMMWLLAFVFARGAMYRMHTRWFKLSPETFDAIHYGGIVVCKTLVFIFNIVPLLAIWIIY